MFGHVQTLIAHLIPLNTINIVSHNKFSKPRLGRFLGLTRLLTFKPDPYPNPNHNPNPTYPNNPPESYQTILTLTDTARLQW